jgi:N-sulfoglucosamine sulfohydrolase
LNKPMKVTSPNILYIHSHDTGRYLQPYGYPVDTPHLQKLAREGVLFRQAFSGAPTCSPSRAALLTGMCAHSSGMLGLAHRGFSLRDPSQHLAHTLRDAGYITALFGIQHEAQSAAALGYDAVYAQGATGPEIAQIAASYLSNDPGQPFFASVGFFETHRPFPPIEDGSADVGMLPASLPDTAVTRADVANFYGSVRALDKQVGLVLNTLNEAGLRQNTLVIFTVDHGIAFPDHKCTLRDGGLGVVLIMRGPGGFSGGRVLDALVSHVDLFPTLVDVLDIEPPEWIQGNSLVPLVQGRTEQVREAVFAEVNYHAAYEPQRAVRTTRWKYIRRFDDRTAPVLPNCDDSPSKQEWLAHGLGSRPMSRESLYDLVLDPREHHNLADDPAYPDVLEELRMRLQAWMVATDDPLLEGPVPAPRGARLNDPDDLSPSDPKLVVG